MEGLEARIVWSDKFEVLNQVILKYVIRLVLKRLCCYDQVIFRKRRWVERESRVQVMLLIIRSNGARNTSLASNAINWLSYWMLSPAYLTR